MILLLLCGLLTSVGHTVAFGLNVVAAAGSADMDTPREVALEATYDPETYQASTVFDKYVTPRP